MHLEDFITKLEKAYFGGGTFLLICALVIFLTLVIIAAVLVYLTACARNKNTQMNGLVKVTVSLNEWPGNAPANPSPKLVYGSTLVSMKDPAGITADRVDPKLGWLQKAYLRQYYVGTLLYRFCENYKSSGMIGDPSCKLLQDLLENDGYCVDLGRISRRGSKKGLVVRGESTWKKDEKNRDKVTIYREIPENVAAIYRDATGCGAQMLCITLEYSSGSRYLN